MAALVHPGEQFCLLVADVPTEFHPRRAGACESPVLDRADGHAEEIGDLTLSEEDGGEGRQEVHTGEVCLPSGASGNIRRSSAENPTGRGNRRVSGDQSGKTARNGPSYEVGGWAG